MSMSPEALALWDALSAESFAEIKAEQDAALKASQEQDATAAQEAQTSAESRAATIGQMSPEDAALVGKMAGARSNLNAGLRDAGKSGVAGALKAFFESKDFVQETAGLGIDPEWKEPSAARQWTDSTINVLEKKSPVNGVVRNLTEFGVGFIGLGKVKVAGYGLKGAATWGGYALDSARAAITGAVAFDPHEERLSNFIQSSPIFANPVSEYLAAKPEDGNAEGRLKAAIESLTTDGLVATAFVATARALKAARLGNAKVADAASEEAERLFAEAARKENLAEPSPTTTVRPRTPEDDDIDRWAMQDGWVPPTQDLPPPSLEHGADALPPAPPPRQADTAVSSSAAAPPTERPHIGALDSEGMGYRLSAVPSSDRTQAARAAATTADIITPEQVQQALKAAQRDADAITKHGSVEAARETGHTFGGQDLIPWQKIGTAETTRAWVGEVLEQARKEMGAVGPIPDARVDALIAQRVRVFNEAPELVRGLLTAAGEQGHAMAANMETAYTPGLNLLQKEYVNAIRGLKGPEEQARAIGQMMMGILLSAYAVQLRMDGRITGAGPQNEQQNQQWRADGNMPYALTGVGEDGKRWHFQLNRLDPIQAPITLLADAADIFMRGGLTEAEESGMAMSLVLALSHQLKNKLYLKSFSDFIQAVTDDSKMASFPKRYAPGLLPFSTLFGNAQQDQYLHEVRTVVDSIKAKLPGYSADVPVRINWLGDRVEAPARFFSKQTNAEPLAKALDEMYATTGTYFGPPAARHGEGYKIDLRDLTLEDGRNAYERYAELAGRPKQGPTLREALTRIAKDPEWQALPHGRTSEQNTREYTMAKVVEDYRRNAIEAVRAESPLLRAKLSERAESVFRAAASGKKDLGTVAAQASMKQVQDLLRSYGIETSPQASPLNGRQR